MPLSISLYLPTYLLHKILNYRFFVRSHLSRTLVNISDSLSFPHFLHLLRIKQNTEPVRAISIVRSYWLINSMRSRVLIDMRPFVQHLLPCSLTLSESIAVRLTSQLYVSLSRRCAANGDAKRARRTLYPKKGLVSFTLLCLPILWH